MPTDMTSKQLNFVSEFTQQVVSLLNNNDAIVSLMANWTNNGFATGAEPSENNITDEVLAGSSFKYMTASDLDQAIAGANAIVQAVAANRGYLEPMRP